MILVVLFASTLLFNPSVVYHIIAVWYDRDTWHVTVMVCVMGDGCTIIHAIRSADHWYAMHGSWSIVRRVRLTVILILILMLVRTSILVIIITHVCATVFITRSCSVTRRHHRWYYMVAMSPMTMVTIRQARWLRFPLLLLLSLGINHVHMHIKMVALIIICSEWRRHSRIGWTHVPCRLPLNGCWNGQTAPLYC